MATLLNAAQAGTTALTDLTPQGQEYKDIFGPYISEVFINYQNFYATDSAFFIMSPPNMLAYYYRIVMRNLWWFRGYVPFIHNRGIFSQNLGNWICKKLATLTLSGGFRLEGYETGVAFLDRFNNENKTLRKLSRLLPTLNGVGFALGKLDMDINGILSMNFIPGNRYFAQTDESQKVIAFRSYIMFASSGINNPRDMQPQQLSNVGENGYYLIQERWLEGDECFERYTVMEGPAYVNNPNFPNPQNVNPDRLSPGILKQFQNKIGYEIGAVYKLPFEGHIGAVIINNSMTATGAEDYTCFADSTLFGVHSLLYEFDLTATQKMFDKYLSQRGVLVPDNFIQPDTEYGWSVHQDALASKIYKKIQYIPGEEQKPVFWEATLRMDAWNGDLKAILNTIAAQIGLTPTTLAGFLDDNQAAATATEINSDESATRITVENKRMLISEALQELFTIILKHYNVMDEFGTFGDINMVFNKEVINDPVKETELAIKQRDGGLIDDLTAIKRVNPHLNNKEAEEMQQQINTDKQKRLVDMDFGL